MVWSAEGRPHPETVRMLQASVRMVRSRKGEEDAVHLRSPWQHEIGVAIQRRKAAMIRAVLPCRNARQEWLERGYHIDDGGHILEPIVENAEVEWEQ